MPADDRDTAVPEAAAVPDAVPDAALRDELARLFPDGVPNLYRTLLRNPPVMAALVALKQRLRAGRLTEAEHCLVALEVAHASECGYCEAALCHAAGDLLGIDPQRLRGTGDGTGTGTGGGTGETRHALLREATRAMIEARGKLGRAQIARYERQGLDFDLLLEIVAVIGEYTLATFAANLDRTRIDPEYRLG